MWVFKDNWASRGYWKANGVSWGLAGVSRGWVVGWQGLKAKLNLFWGNKCGFSRIIGVSEVSLGLVGLVEGYWG